MEVIYSGGADVYDGTDPDLLQKQDVVKKVLTQIEQDYSNGNLQKRYYFVVNRRKYSARVVNNKGVDKIQIIRSYTLITLIRDIIDSFI